VLDCGGQKWSLQEAQAKGVDVGTTVEASPGTPQLLALLKDFMVKNLLWGKIRVGRGGIPRVFFWGCPPYSAHAQALGLAIGGLKALKATLGPVPPPAGAKARKQRSVLMSAPTHPSAQAAGAADDYEGEIFMGKLPSFPSWVRRVCRRFWGVPCVCLLCF
jgi:hypothetical protein